MPHSPDRRSQPRSDPGPTAAPGEALPAAQLVQEEVARYRTTFELAPVGLAHVAPTGELLRVNAALAALLGYAGADLVGRPLQELTHPDDLAASLERVVRVLGGADDAYAATTRYLRADGGVLRARVRARLVRAPTPDGLLPGTPFYFVLVVEPEPDAPAAQLREREGQLALLLRHAPAAVAMLDRDLRYVAASGRWATDLGVPADGLVGRSHYEVFPDVPAHWKAVHQRVLAGAVERADAEPFPRADGRVDWVRWEARPWTDSDGAVGGLVIFAEIVTARVEAERALRAGEARLRAVLEALPVGVFLAEAPSGRLLLANARGAAIWRRPAPSASDVAAYGTYEGFHPDTGRPYAPEEWPLARAVQRGETVSDELIDFRRGDGTLGTLRVSAAPVREADGAAATAVVVFEDVTPLREAAAAERAARAWTERLQAVTAAIGGALTAPEVARVAAEHGAAAVGAPSGGVWALDAAGATLHFVGAVGFPPAVAEALRVVPVDAPAPVAEIVRTGRPLYTSDRTTLTGEFPVDPAALAEAEREAWAGVPLRLGDRLLGCLVFGFAEPHAFSAEERAFMEAVAQQAAQALERARLFDAERDARARAEALGRREAQLRRVTAALSRALSVEDVARAVIAAGRETLGAVAGNLLELRPGSSVVRMVAAVGYPDELVRAWDGVPLSARSPMTEAMREGRVVWYATSAERQARWGAPAPPGYEGAALVPIFLHERVVGGWSLAFAEPRAFDAEEHAFLLALGSQAALAIERAWLFEAERTARVRTERLQALTAALGAARAVDDVARVALDEGARALGLTRGAFLLPSADGARFAVVRAVGGGAAPERACPVPNAPGHPAHDAHRTREPLILRGRADYDDRYPALAARDAERGVHGHAVFPLLATPAPGTALAEAPVIGVLAFEFTEPRPVPDDEARFLAALATVTAQALERAQLAEAERAARAAAEAARADAEAANRAKSEFLAVMSHELRTPLNAIGGYAELIEMGIRGPVSAAQREDLGRIQQSQRHLLGLINQVLNYARVDAGAVQYDLADVPVGEELAAAEALVAPQVRARGLGYAAGPVPPGLLVRADREKLRQVLLNLLSNAVKFTEPGGEVRVGCAARGRVVAITVADTGVGIPPEKLASIFEPFVQVDQRHTRRHEGVGLGLAISRDLARGMGGDLAAESAVGAGSTFTLTLPGGGAPAA